jgi:hypothetical protein
MVDNGSIGADDIKLLYVTDSISDLVAHIETHSIKKFRLIKKQYKPKWWFLENATNK